MPPNSFGMNNKAIRIQAFTHESDIVGTNYNKPSIITLDINFMKASFNSPSFIFINIISEFFIKMIILL